MGGIDLVDATHSIYDPQVISYCDLLQILLIMRNPSTRDCQGPDQGINYRSPIFAHNNAWQKTTATGTITAVIQEMPTARASPQLRQ
jgi:peptide-methionine (S)-S-oxide reductase